MPPNSALARVLRQQSVEIASDKDVNILAVTVQGGKACVNLAMVRGGRHLGDRAYFPVHVEDALHIQGGDGSAPGAAQENAEESAALNAQPPGEAAVDDDVAGMAIEPVETRVLEAFIAQHYIDVTVPPTLVLGAQVSRALIEAISQHAGSRVTAVFQPHEQRRIWLEMAEKNAGLQLARLLAQEGSQQART